jgi:hypothetical protein
LALDPLKALDFGQNLNTKTEGLQITEGYGTLNTLNTPVTILRLTDNFLYDTKNPVTNLVISDYPFTYKNIITVTDPATKEYAKYTLLPFFTGNRGIAIAQIEEGFAGFAGDRTKFYKSMDSNPVGYPYGERFGALSLYYHNKIHNDLVALSNLSATQEQNGPFRAGQVYSTLAMLQLDSSPLYVPGLNSEMLAVTGGGVCLVATSLSKTLALAGAKYVERWEHPGQHRYPMDPEAPAILLPSNTDATVDQGHDLKWVLPQNLDNSWLSINAQVMPTGAKVKDPLVDVDGCIAFSLEFTKENPGNQSKNLLTVLSAFEGTDSGYTFPSTYVSEIPMTRGDATYNWLNTIYPEENRSHFEDELNSDEFLKDLVELQGIINSWTPDGPNNPNKYTVGRYIIHKSDWVIRQYAKCKTIQDENNLAAGLRQLDWATNLVDGQPVQCLGFVELLSCLPNNPGFRSVGGAVNDQGKPASCAAELVPYAVKSGEYTAISTDNGYVACQINSIEEIKPGDEAVRWGNAPGHIMGILANKVINGETWLLIADANAANDGKMRIRQANASMIPDIFGPYPFKTIVLR